MRQPEQSGQPKRKTSPPATKTVRRERNDAAAGRFRLAAAELTRWALEVGSAGAEIQECGHHKRVGCGSMGEFGEMNGLSAGMTSECLRFAKVASLHPAMRDLVLAGTKPLGTVAEVLPFLEDPTLLEAGETIESILEHRSARQVRRLACKRRAKKKDPTRRHECLMHFNDQEILDLERARDLLGRKGPEALTREQVIGIALGRFLDAEDPLRNPLPARRMPSTEGRTDRATSERTKAILAKSYEGKKCAVWLCENQLFCDRAHIWSKCKGGHQEVRNLLPLCKAHHILFDLGLLRLDHKNRWIVNTDGVVMGAWLLLHEDPPPERPTPRLPFEGEDPGGSQRKEPKRE